MIFNYILLMKNVLNQNNGLKKKQVDLDFLGKPWQTCFLPAKSC